MKKDTISASPEMCNRAANILKAVAHPLRLRIVAILSKAEAHVNQLAEALGAPQTIVSQQLRILRMNGLVEARRTNGFAYYRLVEPDLKKLVQCMEACLSRRGG